MKKKIAKLFVQPSQLTASIPHAVFCTSHDEERNQNIDEALQKVFGVSLGDVLEAKTKAQHRCDQAPNEDIENPILRPDSLASFKCEIHPKGVKGVYVINFALTSGSDTQWFYTEKSAFEKDQAFFEQLIGTVDNFYS